MILVNGPPTRYVKETVNGRGFECIFIMSTILFNRVDFLKFNTEMFL